MNIDIKDLITLDGINRYVVASKVLYENINYYYLININNNKDILFCYEDINELVEIEANDLIQRLIPLFFQNTRNILKEYSNNN